MSRRVLAVLLSLFATLSLLATSCSSPEATANAMFEKGEYEKIIQKYPDTQFARRARAKLADNLFVEKKYDEVIKNYGDTPAAFKAKNAQAENLYSQGKFQELIDQFPGSPNLVNAKNILADSLIAQGKIDSAFKKFPDLPKLTAMKDSLSKMDLDAANKLRGPARDAALQSLMLKWPGTASYKEAARLVQAAKQKK